MENRKRLVVFSGAGLSADSGIPTFRGDDGTWDNHRIDDVCSIHSWKRNFDLVHDFYNRRRVDLARVEPNPMHRLLASWQERYRAELITQNIDNLLERAGAGDVMHVHGDLTEMRCLACGRIWNIGMRQWNPETERCVCGSRKGVKPNVIFFGEHAPAYRSMWKALGSFAEDDVLVVIGTDGAVVPIGYVVAEAPCRKALNTLAPVPEGRWRLGMVRSALFDCALYRPAAEAAHELDRIVSSWMDAPDLATAL